MKTLDIKLDDNNTLVWLAQFLVREQRFRSRRGGDSANVGGVAVNI